VGNPEGVAFVADDCYIAGEKEHEAALRIARAGQDHVTTGTRWPARRCGSTIVNRGSARSARTFIRRLPGRSARRPGRRQNPAERRAFHLQSAVHATPGPTGCARQGSRHRVGAACVIMPPPSEPFRGCSMKSPYGMTASHSGITGNICSQSAHDVARRKPHA
jgi:hypothetical protein